MEHAGVGTWCRKLVCNPTVGAVSWDFLMVFRSPACLSYIEWGTAYPVQGQNPMIARGPYIEHVVATTAA